MAPPPTARGPAPALPLQRPLGNAQAYWNMFAAMNNQLVGPLPPFLTDDQKEQVGQHRRSGLGRRARPGVAGRGSSTRGEGLGRQHVDTQWARIPGVT